MTITRTTPWKRPQTWARWFVNRLVHPTGAPHTKPRVPTLGHLAAARSRSPERTSHAGKPIPLPPTAPVAHHPAKGLLSQPPLNQLFRIDIRQPRSYARAARGITILRGLPKPNPPPPPDDDHLDNRAACSDRCRLNGSDHVHAVASVTHLQRCGHLDRQPGLRQRLLHLNHEPHHGRQHHQCRNRHHRDRRHLPAGHRSPDRARPPGPPRSRQVGGQRDLARRTTLGQATPPASRFKSAIPSPPLHSIPAHRARSASTAKPVRPTRSSGHRDSSRGSTSAASAPAPAAKSRSPTTWRTPPCASTASGSSSSYRSPPVGRGTARRFMTNRRNLHQSAAR